jgi:hypothetical protein
MDNDRGREGRRTSKGLRQEEEEKAREDRTE